MESIFRFLLMPIVWIPIVVILIVLTVRNYRKANRLQVLNVDSVLLMMEIPKDNDKKELAAEQLFASQHDAFRLGSAFAHFERRNCSNGKLPVARENFTGRNSR